MKPGDLPALVDELMPPLVLYARQWCLGAEDVVQEAFIRLASQRSLPDQPKSWLFRVVRNGAISAGRSERRRERHEARGASGRITWFVPPQSPHDQDLDPDQVVAMLEQLGQDQREIVVLHLWGGMSFTEIAELLRSSRSTIHRQYADAILQMRERLGIQCPPKT